MQLKILNFDFVLEILFELKNIYENSFRFSWSHALPYIV
jgi:hypothetical protein